MKKNAKNYLNIIAMLAFLYFLFLTILHIHESRTWQTRFEGTLDPSINILWYLLIALLGAGFAFCLYWYIASRHNSESFKNLMHKTKIQVSGFVSAAAGCLLALVLAAGLLGTLPEIQLAQPSSAVASNTEEDTQEEVTSSFPVPELPPVKPADNLIDQASAAQVIADTQTLYGWLSSLEDNQSVVLAQDGSQLTLLQAALVKRGTQDVPDNALLYGLNAALLVGPGGTVNMLGGSVQTSGIGAGAIAVNGTSASATLTDAMVQTGQSQSPLTFAGFQGQLHVSQSQMYSTGVSSPSFLVRSNSAVIADDVTTQTEGVDSPIIQGSGSFSANRLNANATGSWLGWLYPGAEVTLTSSFVSAGAGALDRDQGMFYFSKTDDSSKNGPARLSLVNTDVTFNPTSAYTTSAPLFTLRDCSAEVTLTGNDITVPSGTLSDVQSGTLNCTLDGQSLYGRFEGDGQSTLNIALTNGSIFAGSINSNNMCAQATLTMDESSRLSLSGDLYLSAYENTDLSNANITTNGFHVYVNGEMIL